MHMQMHRCDQPFVAADPLGRDREIRAAQSRKKWWQKRLSCNGFDQANGKQGVTNRLLETAPETEISLGADACVRPREEVAGQPRTAQDIPVANTQIGEERAPRTIEWKFLSLCHRKPRLDSSI